MTLTVPPQEVRRRLLLRQEIALIDLRPEHAFAKGHPLFACQVPLERLAIEAPVRLPRRDVPIVLYDDGEGQTEAGGGVLRDLGYTSIGRLDGGLAGWRACGYELFEDVNSYSKAFGELVEARRHTPSLAASEVKALIDAKADMVILDARRFDEYRTMSIPTAISVPGAELVLQARALAPDPATRIIVNCAGRTRSLIGAQSLINAGVPNPVSALRNGTIGWLLAGQDLDENQTRRGDEAGPEQVADAKAHAKEVAYRAGVRRLSPDDLTALAGDQSRTLYRFDVRSPEAFAASRPAGFRNAPGGQLAQETDAFAPVRGARIVLADDVGPRADMTASWLAQMGWEVYVLDGGFDGPLEAGPDPAEPRPRGPEGRYRRPYEGLDNATAAMQAYLEWEYGLVDQLARDATHGFFVI
jgi:rhodanese-related sulfurtransferase